MPSTDPTPAEVIRDAMAARLFDVRTCSIARVKSYDPETRTADLVPVIARPIEDAVGDVEHEETCVLPNVPIKWPRAGGMVLHFPLREGNHVLVFATDDSIHQWRESGSVSIPGDRRQHHLASTFAIPGAFWGGELLDPEQEGTLLGILTEAVVLGSETGESRIEVREAGIKLGANATQAVALAPPILTALAALKAWVDVASPAIGDGTLQTTLAPLLTALDTALDQAASNAAATLAQAK